MKNLKLISFLFSAFCLFTNCNEINRKEVGPASFLNVGNNFSEKGKLYKVEETPQFQQLDIPKLKDLLIKTNREFSETIFVFFPYFLESLGSMLNEVTDFIFGWLRYSKLNYGERYALFMKTREITSSQIQLDGKLNQLAEKILSGKLLSEKERVEFDDFIQPFIKNQISLFFEQLNSDAFKKLIIESIEAQLIRLENLEYSLREHARKIALPFDFIIGIEVSGNVADRLLRLSEFENKIPPNTKEGSEYIFPSLDNLIKTPDSIGGIIDNKKIIKCLLLTASLDNVFKSVGTSYEEQIKRAKQERGVSQASEDAAEASAEGAFRFRYDYLDHITANLQRIKIQLEGRHSVINTTPNLKGLIDSSSVSDIISNLEGFIDFLSADEDQRGSFRKALGKNMNATKDWILKKASIR